MASGMRVGTIRRRLHPLSGPLSRSIKISAYWPPINPSHSILHLRNHNSSLSNLTSHSLYFLLFCASATCLVWTHGHASAERNVASSPFLSGFPLSTGEASPLSLLSLFLPPFFKKSGAADFAQRWEARKGFSFLLFSFILSLSLSLAYEKWEEKGRGSCAGGEKERASERAGAFGRWFGGCPPSSLLSSPPL